MINSPIIWEPAYYNEEGTFINSNYQRVNLRANTTYKFSDKVSLTNNINISGSKNLGTDYMNIYYAYSSMPWDDPYDENGNARSFKTAEGIWSKDKINPIQAAENSELSNKSFSFDYDINLNINILKWLTFSSSNRLSAYSTMDKTYYSKAADNLSYFGTGYVKARRRRRGLNPPPRSNSSQIVLLRRCRAPGNPPDGSPARQRSQICVRSVELKYGLITLGIQHSFPYRDQCCIDPLRPPHGA